ncbi:polyhydroxyalkanoate synthesis regulator phasin [Saccharopolyspora lacisalsi]|uniref:Polyhydroxyalkanoate synthesis regulator phasin n=1 Tax=Halosaccharopolyspora lacisalsi TaxID=1000566 RepID=A0A839E0W2_9PSEU|nr:hypothetical protein [Halosaccharopolyspora lacisalsi]MBA8826923.1 polyhydroxyalkanoate synthesis regulator phasin [Halosaccharopolyspora lacisalsi]
MDASEGVEQWVKQVQSGWLKQSPDQLLHEWNYLVEACEDGYDDNVHEYHFDLQVRHGIFEVLADEQLAAMPEMTAFRERVEVLDKRLKAVMLSDPALPLASFPWWEAYPLRYGCEEIAKEYYEGYGISIEVFPKRKERNERTSELFKEWVRRAQSGARKYSPDALIFWWNRLVNSCDAGCRDRIGELDTSVRGIIEEVLRDGRLALMPEMTEFRERVAVLDERFNGTRCEEQTLPLDEHP